MKDKVSRIDSDEAYIVKCMRCGKKRRDEWMLKDVWRHGDRATVTMTHVCSKGFEVNVAYRALVCKII